MKKIRTKVFWTRFSVATVLLILISTFSFGTFERVAEAQELPLPTIASISPNVAEQGETLELSISGTNFADGATLSFSPAVGIAVTSVEFINHMELKVNVTIAEDAPIGSRDVTVTNPDGLTGTLTAGFTTKVVEPCEEECCKVALAKYQTAAQNLANKKNDVSVAKDNFDTARDMYDAAQARLDSILHRIELKLGLVGGAGLSAVLAALAVKAATAWIPVVGWVAIGVSVTAATAEYFLEYRPAQEERDKAKTEMENAKKKLEAAEGELEQAKQELNSALDDVHNNCPRECWPTGTVDP